MITTAASLVRLFLPNLCDGAQGRQPRCFLHLGLQGGVNDHVGAGRHAIHRGKPGGLVGGAIQEIIARIHAGAVDDLGGMGARLCGLAFGDGAIVHHRIQHQAGALLRPEQVAAGREDGRRPRQGRQHGRLGQSQLPRAGAEIDAGRAIHAIGGAAQIDAVEIELQDLLLGQRFFQPRRVDQLGQLARHGALLVGVDDLGGLLADGGTARHPVARPQVQQQGAAQAQGIDAIVVIEAPVLHGDEGGGKIGGHLLQFQPLAHNRAAMADFVAVRIQKSESQRAG